MSSSRPHFLTERSVLAIATPPLLLLLDAALRRGPSRPVEALLDETAHAATALILLKAICPCASRSTAIAVGLAATLIDADHIPSEFFGWQFLTRGTERPYTHSLLTVAACLGLASCAARRRRTLVAAVAFGFAAHLLRDMATGGTPLLWPLTRAAVRYPYWAYVIVLIAATAAIVGQQQRPG